FLQRSVPRFIDIASFARRVVQTDCCFFRDESRSAQQRPKRPMRSVKTEEQQITKERSGFFGSANGGAVGLVNECKVAVARLFLKTSSDFAQRWRIDFLERPAGCAELVERAEKMIGITRDRFCNERRLFVVDLFSGEFFGSDGEEQPEVFAQRKFQPDFAE